MDIPSTHQVRTRLQALAFGEVKRLSAISGVPFTTLWKVRTGETANPGLDTVRLFWSHVDACRAQQAVG